MRRLAAALPCLLLAAGCSSRAPPPVPITIANSANVNAGLMHVALARGLPATHGLDATVQRHAFGKLALEAVLRGEADVATAADVPVVLAALHGEPLVVVATIGTATRNCVLVARRAAGVASPGDLAGRRVVAAALGVAPEQLPRDLFEFQVKLDQALVILLEDQARWAVETGLAGGGSRFDALAAIDPAPLAAAYPEAVRLIR